jgi:YidC/Oxa1 family membrane protein insertase
MFGLLAKALGYCYQLWPSYGGAIVLLTLGIMIVLLPLTLKGTRSMLEMQRLQPEMKRLQNKFKDDRAKLNEEMLALYREHKVNPVGGCLPMILQLPVFFVLYRVLIGLTHRTPVGEDLGGAVTGSARAIAEAGHFNPSYISHTSKLYESLHATSRMMSFGVDLSESVTTALKHGIGHALPFIVLVVVVIATTYIQQVQMQARVPKDQVNPQQQMMMKVMPFMFAVIYLFIPAGVVLYFFVSNMFRIAQQAFITRTMYADMPAQPGRGADAPRGLRALLPNVDSLPKFGAGQRAKAQSGGRGKAAAGGRARSGGGAVRSSGASSGGSARSKAQPAAKPAARSASNGRPGAPARKGPPPPNRSGSKKKRK